jgi:hypothetical protein
VQKKMPNGWSDFTALSAILISLISAVIAGLTYFQNSAPAQLKTQQTECMRTVAARAAIVWDQLQTVLSAEKYKFSLDPYLFPSIQNNIRRLEEALDMTISAGLTKELISIRRNAVPLYCAFVQSLYFVTTLQSTDEIRDALIKEHFTMGMVRLLGQCMSFGKEMLPDQRSYSSLSQEIKDQAWDYLGRIDPKESTVG